MGQCSVTGVEIVNPGCAPFKGSLTISADGLISKVSSKQPSKNNNQILFDGGNQCWALPGFIDIHTHGANGADLADIGRDREVVSTIAEAKLKEGVTSFLPTTWTESRERLKEMAKAVALYKAEGEPFARSPFLHIEGPYISPKQAGAQNPKYIRKPDINEIKQLHKLCPIGLVSFAIESEGSLEFIQAMSSMNISTSAAHSAATYQQFTSARRAGLTHLTHFCNQMSPLHHREIGLVGAGFMDDALLIELICDKQHLCSDMLKLIFKQCSCDRIMLITDSISASHLGDGDYSQGDNQIVVRDGAARIAEGTLAGSTLQFHEGVKNAYKVAGLPLNEIIKTTGYNQAQSLNLHDRGQLQVGKLADITILSKQFEVVATIVGGEIRFLN